MKESFKTRLKRFGFEFVINMDDFTKLFFILLIPAILRHFSYFLAFFSTGIYPSISPESLLIFNQGDYFLFLWEEVFLSFLFSVIYFFNKKLRFLTFGYLIDPIIDLISTIPLYVTGKILLTNFFIRESLIPYLIIGPLLTYKYKEFEDFYKKVYITTFGLFILQILL